ncbi:hypothetical protein [Ilumatobacter sp.]|uniref:hypothetical protein n=1 Tax=Ilumatobacter sp. TaxID=1967498 RepID=UPI003B528921
MRSLSAGDILVNARGRVRIVRTRTRSDDGWNCTDGAPISDVEANDITVWASYSPDELIRCLEVAEQVRSISDEPIVNGGLRTWDACSGRPCVLPKLAAVARTTRHERSVVVSG